METQIESLNIQDAETGESVDKKELQFVDSFQLLSVMESLLFATDKPLTLGALKQVFAGTTVDTKTIKKSMEELMGIYADPTRGVMLEEVHGGWQLRTKLDNMDFLKKIVKQRPFRLSGPALEVLSIIAYKQPIIKHEVDEIRGVESGHLVRALMDKGLVTFEGKTDLPGKPMAYSTTRKFLEIFNLRNLGELPSLGEIDQLLPDGIGEEIEERETLSDVTAEMSQEVMSTYSEGEEELLDITSKLGAITTSSEFFEQEKVRQKQKRDREKAEDIREAVAMGELVEAKDVRWLEKYELSLNAPPPVVQTAEAATVTSAEMSADVSTDSSNFQASSGAVTTDIESVEAHSSNENSLESNDSKENTSSEGSSVQDLSASAKAALSMFAEEQVSDDESSEEFSEDTSNDV